MSEKATNRQEEKFKKKFGWICPVCKKFDLASTEERMGAPEHVPYRGIDIGKCKGNMIDAYSKSELERLKEKLIEGCDGDE